MVAEFHETSQWLDRQEGNVAGLIDRLSGLVAANDQAAASQTQIRATVDALNDVLPELNLNYQDVIRNGADFVEIIQDMARAEAERRRYQEYYERYVGLLQQEMGLERDIANARNDKAAAQERYNEALAEQQRILTDISAGFTLDASEALAELNAAREALEYYTAAYDKATDAIETNRVAQEQALGVIQEVTEAQNEAAEGFDAVTQAALDYAAALSGAFNEAHEAAYASLMGQVSLTREFAGETAIAFDQVMRNAESWQKAFDNYNKDLQLVIDMGLDTSIAEQQFSTFSPDNAGIIAALASAGEEGIAAFNEQMSTGVSGAADQLASTFASISPEFVAEVAAMMEAAGEAASEGTVEMMAQIVAAIVDNGGLITEAEIQVIVAAHAEATAATAGEAAAVGTSMVEGIAAGATASGSILNNALTAIVRNAINAAKAEARISSPSKETADLLGEPLGEGIEVGIYNKMQDIQKAMTAAVSMDSYREAQRIAQSDEYRHVVSVHPALMSMMAAQPAVAAPAPTATTAVMAQGGGYSTATSVHFGDININIPVEVATNTGALQATMTQVGHNLIEMIDDRLDERERDRARRAYR